MVVIFKKFFINFDVGLGHLSVGDHGLKLLGPCLPQPKIRLTTYLVNSKV